MNSGPMCLAVTFLLIGVGFAWPGLLWAWPDPSFGAKSVFTLNLFALTAYLGLSHFVYAFYGQFGSLWKRQGPVRMLAFIAIVAMIFPLLRVTRDQMGWRIFDGLVWSYFIAHFIKAELFIAKTVHGPDLRLMSKDVRNVFLIPLVSFVYLSLALLAREFWVERQLELFFLGVLVTIVCFAMGAARDLFDPTRWPYMLTAAFLIGEGFVWGRFGPFMDDMFADGVYGVHVAAASFFHYARSYEIAMRLPHRGWLLTSFGILAVNLTTVAIGQYLGHVTHPFALTIIFSPAFFTTWVALHLIASDLFPLFKRARKPVFSETVERSEKMAESIPVSAG